MKNMAETTNIITPPSEASSKIRELFCELGFEESVFLDPVDLDSAVVGHTDEGRVIYDYEKLVEAFMAADGMTDEEAREWIDYNTLRALPYIGEKAPIVMYSIAEYV